MGTLSWTLTILAANGALTAALLARAAGNRAANSLLSALVGLISLRLAIYVLGFAGAYDSHPWITFLPLDASLAFGPLLWLYVVALTRGCAPAGWRRHLVPAAVQLGYQGVAFTLPLDAKLAWFAGVHLHVIAPLGLAALLLSSTTYLALAWRRQRDYQRWLDDRFADRDSWRLGWITWCMAVFGALIAVAAVATLVNVAVTPLDYFARTPVVVASSLVAYVLGLVGWHHAGLGLPPQPDFESGKESSAEEPSGARMSRPAAAFAGWAQRIEAEGWWREEGITLGEIARRLGLSERTLSRGFAEGGASNFNAFVNALRVRAITRAIEGGAAGDLLSIALDCGFSSKASFNRAFRQFTGITPSAFRAGVAQHPPIEAAGAA